jgi:hypothetical protein
MKWLEMLFTPPNAPSDDGLVGGRYLRRSAALEHRSRTAITDVKLCMIATAGEGAELAREIVEHLKLGD